MTDLSNLTGALILIIPEDPKLPMQMYAKSRFYRDCSTSDVHYFLHNATVARVDARNALIKRDIDAGLSKLAQKGDTE